MKKSSIIVLFVSAVALVSGCEYYKPTEIVYRDVYRDAEASSPASGSDDSEIIPSGEGTRRAEGTGEETVSGDDEVILPSEERPVAGGDEIAPPPESRPADADGVADDAPEVGRAPEEPSSEPVSCDEPAFAFVSKRGGRSDVYVHETSSVRKLTSNNHDYRTYQNISFKPASRTFAVDDFFIVHPLLPAPVLSVLLGDLGAESFALEPFTSDAYSSSLVWNARGTKSAYIAIRSDLISEIRVHEERTGVADRVRVVTSNESDSSLKFGKVAWAGDQLLYSVVGRGVTTLHYVYWNSRGEPRTGVLQYESERTPVLDPDGREILGDDGLPVTRAVWETVHASDPSVSPDGRMIAFVVSYGSVSSNIVTCRFGRGEFDLSDYRSKCRDVSTLPGLGHNTSPSWSPDGRWIYFVSDRDGNKEIYRIRPDGTGEERLTNDPAADTSPAPFAPYASCE